MGQGSSAQSGKPQKGDGLNRSESTLEFEPGKKGYSNFQHGPHPSLSQGKLILLS